MRNSCEHQSIGGVAQWLGCLSLAGGLLLPCTRSMVDRCPLCGETVRCGSPNYANLAFHPPWICKW